MKKFKSNEIENLNWVSGFVDGEGCFRISFNLNYKLKNKIEVRPSFSVTQKKDKLNINNNLLLNLVKIFNCGTVKFSKHDQIYKYEVRNLNLIYKNIIPFFDVYKLYTSKKNDFELFKEVIFLMLNSKHLNIEGLIKIIDLSFQINQGKRKYRKEFLLKLLNK